MPRKDSGVVVVFLVRVSCLTSSFTSPRSCDGFDCQIYIDSIFIESTGNLWHILSFTDWLRRVKLQFYDIVSKLDLDIGASTRYVQTAEQQMSFCVWYGVRLTESQIMRVRLVLVFLNEDKVKEKERHLKIGWGISAQVNGRVWNGRLSWDDGWGKWCELC